MSFKVVLVIEKDYSKENLRSLKLEYQMPFEIVDYAHESLKIQIQEDEILIDPSLYHSDSNIGIGRYDFIMQDAVEKVAYMKEEGEISIAYRSAVWEGLYLQDIMSQNIKKWTELLTKMKKKYHFKNLGLLTIFGDIEEAEQPVLKKMYCRISDLTPEFLMKLDLYSFVYFTD